MIIWASEEHSYEYSRWQQGCYTQIHDPQCLQPDDPEVLINAGILLSLFPHLDCSTQMPHTNRRLSDVVLKSDTVLDLDPNSSSQVRKNKRTWAGFVLRTKISSSLGPVGPAIRRSWSLAIEGVFMNSNVSRTDSIATRRSKGWERNFGLIRGGSFGSDDFKVISPSPWLPLKATAVARYCSDSCTPGWETC